ncbi:putative lipid II flippase FtsW [Trichococcus collinsii]|uniref:Probable peptidoglycan glycosyltransferase FtsW n=1 Tax=Trichococcus collinsii TaxID=157076 RepID=A0AB37ZXK5_9LACT|nr:putative lipid II flippase FtsW [Trichococcus collinsii]CZQ85040.1 cell cycle proteins ftsw / roda / spove signature [Trichococcus collinsii]SDZ80161.1 cell division protein FtsW [Trichococcus collinsii]
MIKNTINKKFSYMDWRLLIPYIILSGFGILMVYSSSSYRAMTDYNNSEHFFYRQMLFAILGLFGALFVSFLSKRLFKNEKLLTYVLFGLFVILTYLLLWPGTATKGARGWIYIGSFGFQPAEFMKLNLILYLSWFISKHQSRINDAFYDTMKKPLLIIAAAVVMVFLQPDLGGAAIIAFICLVLFLHSGVKVKYGVIIFGAIGATYALIIVMVKTLGSSIPFIQSYQMERITSFIDPFADIQDSGYQVVNSYYALSRGGLFGVGIGESIQKSGYLPEPHTDFILSIIGEELGLMGVAFVLVLFFYMVYRIFKNAIKIKDPFAQLVCIGIGTMFLAQGVINVGGATGLMPLTGVTFPFVSYGGSSLLVSAVSIGLVNNMYINDQISKQPK